MIPMRSHWDQKLFTLYKVPKIPSWSTTPSKIDHTALPVALPFKPSIQHHSSQPSKLPLSPLSKDLYQKTKSTYLEGNVFLYPITGPTQRGLEARTRVPGHPLSFNFPIEPPQHKSSTHNHPNPSNQICIYPSAPSNVHKVPSSFTYLTFLTSTYLPTYRSFSLSYCPISRKINYVCWYIV